MNAHLKAKGMERPDPDLKPQNPAQQNAKMQENIIDAFDAEFIVPNGRNTRSLNCRISIVKPLFT